MPFGIRNSRHELACGWAKSIFTDQALCYAFGAHEAYLQARNAPGGQQERHALIFETQALTALRQRVDAQTRLSEHTILLAALHFITLGLRTPDARELHRAYEGIHAMIMACGGANRMSKQMHMSTVLSVEICASFCTLLVGTRPLYPQAAPPRRPHSFEELYPTSFQHAMLERRCDPDVSRLMRNLACVLFFRRPSHQSRPFTSEESSYFFQLLRYIDNQLDVLQVEHEGAGTLSEVMVMGLIVLKREVVPISTQHVIVTIALLRRLRTSILASLEKHTVGDELHQDTAIWACFLASFGVVLDERAKFEGLLVKMINLRYGNERRSCDWQANLLQSLRTMPWHSRLDDHYTTVYNKLLSDERADGIICLDDDCGG